MRKKLTLITGLALLAQQFALCQTSLEECIRNAYENYPQIEEYSLIEASRNYDLSNAAKAWMPQLSVSGKATWQSDVVEMPFDIMGFNFDIPHDQYGIVADINQQVFDGGAASVRRKLADAGADVKKSQLDVNLYAIRKQVQNIYLGIILIDRQLELNELLSENLARNLREMDALLDAGVVLATDKDQLMVNLLGCDQQRASLERDRKAYVRMLSLMTGKDVSASSFVEPRVSQPAGNADFNARPEFKLYDSQAKQIALQQEQLSTSLYPRLNFNVQAGYGRPGLNMLSGNFDPYVVVGLKMQWNIASLYTLKNDRMKLKAESNRLELAKKSFQLNTSIESEQKMSEVDKAADVISRDEEIIRLRQSIRENAENQYREGIIKMNDYLDILDEEFKARLNGSLHSIQYTMAVLDLQNTTGQ